MQHRRTARELARQVARLLYKDELGITGLETAIVLIAFVIVASVFAYAVLTTGLFSAERGKETVLKGLQETRSTLEMRGNVAAERGGTGAEGDEYHVAKIRFMLAPAAGGGAINLTKADTVVTYIDKDQHATIDADDWATAWKVGAGDMLDPGEMVEVEITLSGLTTKLAPNKEFTIQLKPQVGAVVNVTRRSPIELKPIMNLD